METLKATDVMRRDTLASVSHDLRTPLTTRRRGRRGAAGGIPRRGNDAAPKDR